MNIKNNVIKSYLKNVLFVNGTPYAGKSTVCKKLAERYNLIHCEENYNSDLIFKVINENDQPSLSYFTTMKSWDEFVNRQPSEFASWLEKNEKELVSFEIAELIRISKDQKVIVDTNIPLEILVEIADYNQIAIMLSTEEMAVDKFFDRPDEEKAFIKEQIMLSNNPKATLDNYLEGLRISYRRNYDKFTNSNCFIIKRENYNIDTLEATLEHLANHFELTK